MRDLLEEGRNIQQLFKNRVLSEAFGEWNAKNFVTNITDILKKAGYEVEEAPDQKMDPTVDKMMDTWSSENGKKLMAAVGITNWGDGKQQIFVATPSQPLPSEDVRKAAERIKKLEDELYKIYGKDFKFNAGSQNGGKVNIFSISNK
jgi:hypothetical protein